MLKLIAIVLVIDFSYVVLYKDGTGGGVSVELLNSCAKLPRGSLNGKVLTGAWVESGTQPDNITINSAGPNMVNFMSMPSDLLVGVSIRF